MNLEDLEQRIKTLEERVRAVEDLEEIKKLQREYMSCHDNLQFEKILDFFTEDAEVEVRQSGLKKGKKEFAEIFIGHLAGIRTSRPRHEGHLVSQPIISVEGDKAKGTWLVYMFFSQPTVEWIQGMQDCEYVKENGKWKFSKLKFTRTFASKPELYP